MNRILLLKDEPRNPREITGLSGLKPGCTYFVLSKKTRKIYGPSQVRILKGGYSALNSAHRRGVILPNGLSFPSKPADQPLTNELAGSLASILSKANDVQKFQNNIIIRMGKSRVTVTVVDVHPHPFIKTFDTPVDSKTVHSLSRRIESLLLLMGRSRQKKDTQPLLRDIGLAGRSLYGHLFKDPFFDAYFRQAPDSFISFHMDGSCFFLPVEYLDVDGPFCLKFAMSRTVELPGNPGYASNKNLEPTLLLFASGRGSSFPEKERLAISHLLLSHEHAFDMMSLGHGFETERLERYGLVHFSGHGTWKKHDYSWASCDLSVHTSPVSARNASFIFSNACNGSYFSPQFGGFAGKMSANGLQAWLGPVCPIQTPLNPFAETFYPHFLSGKPIAEAVLLARRQLAENLMKEAYLYGLIGHPFFRFRKKN